MRMRHIIPCHTAKWYRRVWTREVWMASKGKSQKRSVVRIWKCWNHRTKEFLNWKFCETDRGAKGKESHLLSSYITPQHLLLVIVWRGHQACQYGSSHCALLAHSPRPRWLHTPFSDTQSAHHQGQSQHCRISALWHNHEDTPRL